MTDCQNNAIKMLPFIWVRELNMDSKGQHLSNIIYKLAVKKYKQKLK